MARTTLGLLLVFGFLAGAAGRARAADRDQALAVVEEAIKAHGGADNLARARFMNRTSKGVLHLFGKENTFTAETVFALPNRYRDAIVVEAGGQKNPLTMVINVNKGWQLTGGAVADLSKERLAEVLEEEYVVWLSTLVPLRDKAFELAPVPDAKVLGQPADAVKVSSKGHADVTLTFDKQSKLLVKINRRALESGVNFTKEIYLRDHKEFDGVKLATKQVELINGNKSIELTITSYKFPAKIDESTFAKP